MLLSLKLIEESMPSQKVFGKLSIYDCGDGVFRFDQQVFLVGQENETSFKIYGEKTITTAIRADDLESAKKIYQEFE